MALIINELQIWQYQTPVVSIGIDSDFDNWQYQTPDEEKDESYSTPPIIRRRAMEF
jgi:hypothetical protein